MRNNDEELLNLYAQDQEERKQFSLLKTDTEREKMLLVMQRNDEKRKVLVAELLPLNTQVVRSAEDYYIAAIIYSRGESVGDRKKAQAYAKKAYNLVQFKHDDFAERVKALYDRTNKNLVIKASPVLQGTMPNTPAQRRLNQINLQKRKEVEKDRRDDMRAERQDRANDRQAEQQDIINDRLAEERRLRNRPQPKTRCSACGGEHLGPCPYR